MSNNIKIDLYGDWEKLANDLRSISSIRWDAVCEYNITQIYNRARMLGGTPRDSGELVFTSQVSLPNGKGFYGEMGYIKEYAPHVEYGHRMVQHGKTVGYVKGQRYLNKNVQIQKPIFYKSLLDNLKKVR